MKVKAKYEKGKIFVTGELSVSYVSRKIVLNSGGIANIVLSGIFSERFTVESKL